MRIVFCDDSKDELTSIKKSVLEFFNAKTTIRPTYASYDNGDSLLAHETIVDMAFLDVEMPGGVSGIYVAEQLKKHNPLIKVFIITAHPDYINEALDLQLFRYLPKPVNKNYLFRCIKVAINKYLDDTVELPIITKDGLTAIRSHQIVCVEYLDKSVVIQTTSTQYKIADKMEKWKANLSLPSFYEPYRDVIINLNYVVAFNRDTVTLRWSSDEKTVYLARRKFTEFRNKYSIFCGGHT